LNKAYPIPNIPVKGAEHELFLLRSNLDFYAARVFK